MGGVLTDAAPRQLVTLRVERGLYGIDIGHVREIRAWSAATRIPRSPPHVLGVLNLRGAIVPLLDLRLCCGLSALPPGPTSVVVVVRGAQGRDFGLVADAVCDVVAVDPALVRTAPGAEGTRTDEPDALVRELVMAEPELIMVLEVGRLASLDEAQAMPVAAS